MPATEPDHIVTVKQADALGWPRTRTHADDNLRPKCKSHHSRRTARDQSGWTKRAISVTFEDRCCTGAVPPSPPPIENSPTWG